MIDLALPPSAFALALDAAPIGVILVSAERITWLNAAAGDALGYGTPEGRAALVGRGLEVLITATSGATREAIGLHRDGRALRLRLTRERLAGAGTAVDMISLGELGELRQQNAELEDRVAQRTRELTATVKEREALLQEVHHRVKNNLQVVSSLLNTQIRKLPPAASGSRDALRDCQRRVETIALIHEQLYRSGNYGRIPLAEYVRSLASNVFEATGASPARVTLELAIEDVVLGVDRAIPCGLIINELITNALKHGFPAGRAGRVRVELRRTAAGLLLAVADDGVGLPAGFALAASNSMGLQLVQTLGDQLRARLALAPGPGVRFELVFEERA